MTATWRAISYQEVISQFVNAKGFLRHFHGAMNFGKDSSEEDSVNEQASALAPMRHPVFKAVWFASLASNLGSLIQSVGAAWLMTSITGSADMVALVQASTSLPVMLLS